MTWTTERKVFIVEAYFRQKSIRKAQLRFKNQFRCREFPDLAMTYRWVNKFRTHGTVYNLNHKDLNRQSHSGRPKSSKTLHNVATVRNSVSRSPSKSVCRRSELLGIPLEYVRRILIADLSLYAYRIQIKQKFKLEVMRKRKTICQWFCNKIDAVPAFLDNVWFSDEENFVLSGHVNFKNRIFWGSTPLSTVYKDHYTLLSALHGLPFPSMASLDHSDSKTIALCDNQRRLTCSVSSGHHLVDGKMSSGYASDSSRTVPPHTPQKNHWHG